MGLLSRLLGEIEEETKYKPSSEFKIKTGSQGYTISEESVLDQIEPAPETALDVRELLIESHPKLSKEEIVEAQKNASRIMGIIAIVILVMVGLVAAFGYEAVQPLLSWAWIIVAIPFLFFGKRKKKLFKLTK